jgi:hypothetical protein
MDNARFTDEALALDSDENVTTVSGKAIDITPSSWQVQIAYQLDFNPFVEVIGAQGTYLVVGYSESEDLAGAMRVIDEELTRVGFVPKQRLNVGIGEWLLEGLRVAVEYSHNWDYSVTKGGTGRSADGVFAQVTYEW